MSATDVSKFFEERVPKSWFTEAPRTQMDDDEILVTGVLPLDATVEGFRETTRSARIAIAEKAESQFRRNVSWAVERDGVTTLFTNQSSPVMTRLRLRERAVLDTLVEAGVARSRSEALAWCVKLVGRHEADWLAELREALVDVSSVRAKGPTLI